MPGGEGYNSGPGEVTPQWTPQSTPWDGFDEVRPPCLGPFVLQNISRKKVVSAHKIIGYQVPFFLFFCFLLILDYCQGDCLLYRDLVLCLTLEIGSTSVGD